MKTLYSLSSYSFFLWLYGIMLLSKQIVEQRVLPISGIMIAISTLLLAILLAKLVLIPARRSHSNQQAFKLVKPLEPTLLPVYISLFIIPFSLADLNLWLQLLIVCVFFILWRFIERNAYLNVFWLVLGYRFYEASNSSGQTVTLITKSEDLKGEQTITNLSRLNNYTFLEVQL